MKLDQKQKNWVEKFKVKFKMSSMILRAINSHGHIL